MKKLILLCMLSMASVQAATTYISPATGNFDLRQWKITLPIADSSGDAQGESMSAQFLFAAVIPAKITCSR